MSRKSKKQLKKINKKLLSSNKDNFSTANMLVGGGGYILMKIQ